MKITKKILSMLLALAMVLGLLPATAFATGTEDVVYLSISFDGRYIDDKNGNTIAYVPISLADIASVDLEEYGLEHMRYDCDGDGEFDTTALQLIIYAHENLYGGDWSEVSFDDLPGSSYFAGGVFGFTENLVYFHNGDFPVDESQDSGWYTVGATSDRIGLKAGDFLDIASFSCYAFLWDMAGGFHLFADPEGNYIHDYFVEKEETLSVKLMHSFCDLMYGEGWVTDATDYEIYYGHSFGKAEGSIFTDDTGYAALTFPEAGTYYIWCDGDHGSDDGTHIACDYCIATGEPCIVSAPAYARVTVTGEDVPETSDITLTENTTMDSLVIPADATLDLNGFTLCVDSLVSFGQIVDTAGGGKLLANTLQVSDNEWLLIRDSAGYYRCYRYQLSNLGVRQTTNGVTFGFALDFVDADAYATLMEATDLQITATLTAGEFSQTFAFSSELIHSYGKLQSTYPSLKATMMLTVTGVDTLADGTGISVTPAISAVNGNLNVTGAEMTYMA